MNTSKQIRILATLVGLSIAATSQAADNDAGTWITASAAGALPTGRSDTNWRYGVIAQYRFVDTDNAIQQYVLRPSVGLKLSDRFEARIGYARFETDRQRGPSSHENRWWQQLNWTAGQWQGGTLSVRTRLAQRSVSTGDDLGMMLRVMAKYVRPFESRNDRYFVASIEPFVDLRDTDWGADKGLSQNRVYLGAGQRLNARTTIEIAYMLQSSYRDNAPDQNNHLAMISFNFRP